MSPARRLLLSVVPLLIAASSLPAAAETFVFSHLLETSGSILDTQTVYDTDIYMTYTAGLAGTDPGLGASVDVYIFDEQTGQPLVSATALDVCAPCTFPLGDGSIEPRKRKINIGSLIEDKGGFPSVVVTGFAVVVVNGDAGNVAVTSAILHANTGPQDLSVFVFEPQPIAAAAAFSGGAAGPVGGWVHVAPEVVETPGLIPYAFDSEFFLTYSGGVAGIPDGGGADVDIYLFDEATGSPMVGGGGSDVCNPCTFAMGTGAAASVAPRKRSIVVENLISAAGGFGGAPFLSGFAMIVARGADPGAVNLGTIVLNGRSGPNDLTVFVFEPQPIATAAPVTVESDVTGDVSSLRAHPNPASGGSRFDFSLARASDVSLEIFDAQGRRMAELPLGLRQAGDHTVRWNGRDTSGRAVPAGTYFGRLGADDGSRITRLVMLSH